MPKKRSIVQFKPIFNQEPKRKHNAANVGRITQQLTSIAEHKAYHYAGDVAMSKNNNQEGDPANEELEEGEIKENAEITATVEDSSSVNKQMEGVDKHQKLVNTISSSTCLPSLIKNHPGINLVFQLKDQAENGSTKETNRDAVRKKLHSVLSPANANFEEIEPDDPADIHLRELADQRGLEITTWEGRNKVRKRSGSRKRSKYVSSPRGRSQN